MQRILHTALAVIDPTLDRRQRQIELPAGLDHRGLALDDVQYQRRLAPGCPTLDLCFHHAAHQCLLLEVSPEQEITGSLHFIGRMVCHQIAQRLALV